MIRFRSISAKDIITLFLILKEQRIFSSGIGVFIHCLCDVQENNGSIYIIAMESQVKEVLHMVGIDRLIKIYSSEKEFLKEHKDAVS